MIGTLMNNGRTCVLKENGGSKKIPVHPEQYDMCRSPMRGYLPY